MSNNQDSIFDQFHLFVIQYWRKLVITACVVVAVVSLFTIKNYYAEQLDKKHASLYYEYTKSDRAQQLQIAQSIKRMRHSNYLTLIALWESKYHFDAQDNQSSKEWLRWADTNNKNPVLSDLIQYRLLNVCFQINDTTCINAQTKKLSKTPYKLKQIYLEITKLKQP